MKPGAVHAGARTGNHGTARVRAAAVVVMAAVAVAAAVTGTMQASFAQTAHAEEGPDIVISMGKPAYQYCDMLSYSISVSEVTGQVALSYIIDEDGKSSQAIPISLDMQETEIRAPFPFEREIFPAGTYTISIEYSGARASADFELVDSGITCLPSQLRQITAAWLSGTFHGGFLIDSIKKSVDSSVIDVPFEIGRDTIYRIVIPEWVKTAAYWWVTGEISDDAMAGMLDYLLESGAIYVQAGDDNGGGGASGEGQSGPGGSGT